MPRSNRGKKRAATADSRSVAWMSGFCGLERRVADGAGVDEMMYSIYWWGRLYLSLMTGTKSQK